MTDFSSRHPELVSGSISPSTQVQRGQTQPNGQVMPIGIVALNQIDLPLPVPVFKLLLTRNRRGHVAKQFVAIQKMDPVLRGETLGTSLSVLPEPSHEVAGDTDVERAEWLASKDVDARVSLNRHEAELGAKWTLKQVQGDERGETSRSKLRHPELVSASIRRLGAEFSSEKRDPPPPKKARS